MLSGRTALVTGGGQGIGRAIARMLCQQEMRVAVCDLDLARAKAVAAETGGVALCGDLRLASDVEDVVENARSALGRIDMLVSNAGFAKGAVGGPTSVTDDLWQDSWDLHVMAHLRATRLVLPAMLEHGEGWVINIASAAGLLSQIGDAPYSASKHAAVSLAQSLAIEHGGQGVEFACVCPLYVATPLLGYDSDAPQGQPNARVLSSEDIADALLSGLQDKRFLILPHAEAGTFFLRRATDMERWIVGMRRLRERAFEDGLPEDLADLHRRI